MGETALKSISTMRPIETLVSERTEEEYFETTRPLFDFTPVKSAKNKDRYSVLGWKTDACLFFQAETDAFAINRTKAQIEDSGHLVVLHKYLYGGWRGVSGDLQIERLPENIYFTDQALPITGLQDRCLLQTVYINKAKLGMDASTLPSFSTIDRRSTSGKCMHLIWQTVFDRLIGGATTVRDEILQEFLACISICLGTHPQRGDVRIHARNALERTICDFIERNLQTISLSPETILRTFGVSRASLYRMFEPFGGVRNYIMERRTIRAILDISTDPALRGQIQRASDRWGFSTSPNFNRSVKRMFGTAPGQLFVPRDQDHHPTISASLVANFVTASNAA